MKMSDQYTIDERCIIGWVDDAFKRLERKI